MSLLRVYACGVIAAGLCLAIQPAAALPIVGPGPGAPGASDLLHLVHGRHSTCIGGHRHRSDGLPVSCAVEDSDDEDGPDDEDDEGPDVDEGGGEGVCVQVGPVELCQ